MQITRRWTLVFNGCKSSEAVFIDVDAQWVNTVDEDVETEIKLKPVNQVGFMHVTLNNHVLNLTGRINMLNFLSCQILWISGQEYSFSLTTCFRFDDECFISFGIYLTCEFLKVLG